MTAFMASLAGIPPLAGWFAKFAMFRSIVDAGTGWAYILAVIAAVNSVIAFYYYFRVIVQMWFRPVASDDHTPIRMPQPLAVAIGFTAMIVLSSASTRRSSRRSVRSRSELNSPPIRSRS